MASFITDVVCVVLNVKDDSRGSRFSGIPTDLPPHLISAVIKAVANAFGTDNIKILIKSYNYVLGLDRVIAKPSRIKKNDVTLLTTLFDVLCPGPGVGQVLGMSADEYDIKLTDLLVDAYKYRLFQEIEVSQNDQSELSSVLKKYFSNFSHTSTRWSNILRTIKGIHHLVDEKSLGIIWGPPTDNCLERVFASEFSFKAFNHFLPEERIRMLATHVG